MDTIDLRVRDLNTGASTLQSFAGEGAACAWLTARPRFVEVLGVANVGIDREVDARLRAALRPLDADERALAQKLDGEHAAMLHDRQVADQKRVDAAEQAHRDSLRTADPGRPMEVHFTYNGTLCPSDPSDTRPISEEVKTAVMAWVHERDEWVASRNQVVGDAKVVVWPGAVPKGEERVKRGTFIPVTAPKKD